MLAGYFSRHNPSLCGRMLLAVRQHSPARRPCAATRNGVVGTEQPMPQNSEATVNAALADALRHKHPLWRDALGVEQSGVFPQQPALRPDIVVRSAIGQPIVVETEFAPAATVERDAAGRLGLEPAGGEPIEQVLAVRLPADLRRGQADLSARVAASEFGYCVLSGEPAAPKRWPTEGWLGGGLNDIARCMEQAMMSTRLIEEGMTILELGVRHATATVEDHVREGEIYLPIRLGEALNQQPGTQTTRMAMTIIANALLFHDAIAERHKLPSMTEVAQLPNWRRNPLIQDTWQRILTEINYWPIFRLAIDLLAPFPGVPARKVLNALVRTARELSGRGITTQQDLSGRMFQRLIADRKFLATFYTRPESAQLLGELAVARMSVDWDDLAAYPNLRVADLSCGTGTLLVAAYRALLARYRHSVGDDAEVHAAMLERAVVAADIMPAAAHLCAAQLSSVHPGEVFENTRVYTMPYGVGGGAASGRGVSIGSLDLIAAGQSRSLFPTGQRQAQGRGDAEVEDLDLPHASVDLVIMNPPFTRPTNHEAADVPVPSFAGFSTSADEQRLMSERLAEIRRGLDTAVGHGNAGLASNFIDLAHAKAKPGGVVALVLPITSIQGVSWQAARTLFATGYADIVVVTVAVAGNTESAFSADTGMGEALLVATKCDETHAASGDALFVNLFRRPHDMVEASDVAKLIDGLPEAPAGHLRAGGQRLGTYIRARLEDGGCAALRESALAEAMMALRDSGELRMPRHGTPTTLPMTPLGALGQRGPLHRDIGNRKDGKPPFRGPFKIVPASGVPSYPALWAHSAERERRLVVAPDSEGVVRPGCEEHALRVWRTAATLHFSLDFGISSQSLTACLTPAPCLGGRAWPGFQPHREEWTRAIALWANCTLGLMAFWWAGSRQQQGRAITTISALPELPVLDARALTPEQLERANAIFERFRAQTLLPANEAYRDDARKALDRAVLVELLGLPEAVLPPLDNLRLQWCAEPSVHGGKETAPDVGVPEDSP